MMDATYTRIAKCSKDRQHCYDEIVDQATNSEFGIVTYPAGVRRWNAKGAIFTARNLACELLGSGTYQECIDLLTNQSEPTYPPVSGGSPEMDADETACGALCQELNDRMWDKLGPVVDVELPF